MNLVGFLIKEFMRVNKLTSMAQFGKAHGIPDGTVNDWVAGNATPRSPKHRAKLFELLRHPVFEGTADVEKIKRMKSPPQKGDAAYITKSPISPSLYLGSAQIDRLPHLVKAMLPDLRAVIIGSPEARRKVKQAIGDSDFNEFFVGVRALSSEAAYATLESEGMLKSLKGGG